MSPQLPPETERAVLTSFGYNDAGWWWALMGEGDAEWALTLYGRRDKGSRKRQIPETNRRD